MPGSFNKNQILIMPTWRNWLSGKIGQSYVPNFKESEYFITWNSLLNNKNFLKLLEKYDLQCYFFQHSHMQKYHSGIVSTGARITIANWQDYDGQELLKSSGFLVTDYSSIAMDFAYMRKPLLYYQFDREEFRKKQYQEGYFSYEKDGFGEVVLTAEALLEKLHGYAETDFTPKEVYLRRIEQFYAYFDKNNCERTFNAIKNENKKYNSTTLP
ncbi:MAG: CDP-glycerol glycerophosphotransferase family protein [Firmicutes bacterium]|nr:CDP-glycerol glycerophosphotransferase family protein [Bacillota bacterium]